MFKLEKGTPSISKEKLVQEGLFQISYNIDMSTMAKAKSSTIINPLVLPIHFHSPPRGKNPFLTKLEGEKNPDKSVQLYYKKQQGKLFLGDSLVWLKSLQAESVDLVFADPPYNIKKADWDRFESSDHYVSWSKEWIKESARILKPNGTLYICGFTEILADIKVAAMPFFESCRWIIWHYKNKANLGNDWGRSHESIVHFRKGKNFIFNIDAVRIPYGAHTLKYPSHPQAETSQYGKSANNKPRENWIPNPKGAKPKDVMDIPTTCNGMGEKTPHPTQKPEELLRKIVLASSNPGDLIVDPFSGSGTTLVAAEQLGRRWYGCDYSKEYNEFAVNRLNSISRRSVQEWIKFDADIAKRRESIR
ncbi:MAG: DNA methyltransferase [Elusimicrobia bacterium]|nr:DNA methyltransferase [Elusimicrobiota bacterium]